MKLLRPVLLSIALVASAGVFAWSLTTAEPRYDLDTTPREASFGRAVRDLIADGDWSDAFTLADDELTKQLLAAKSQDSDPPTSETIDTRWPLLFRAWASEALAATNALDGREPPRGCWARLDATLNNKPGDPDQSGDRRPTSLAIDFYFRGWAAHGLGRSDEAKRHWSRCIDLHLEGLNQIGATSRPVDIYLLSNFQSLAGDQDAALETLLRSVAVGFNSLRWAAVDPDLADLREAYPARSTLALQADRLTGRSVRAMLTSTAAEDPDDARWFLDRVSSFRPAAENEVLLFYADLLATSPNPADHARAETIWLSLAARFASPLENGELRIMPEPGDTEAIDTLLRVMPTPEPPIRRETCHTVGWALRGLGRTEASRAMFTRYIELTQEGIANGAGSGGYYDLACGFALVGDRDSAIDALKMASQRGYGNLRWALVDPDLRDLSDDVVRACLGISLRDAERSSAR